MMDVHVFPIWAGGKNGYRYNVTFDGDLIIDGSHDPECDLARALLARGITGRVTVRDGNTGKPRSTVNIEKAAKLRMSEENRDGLRWRNCHEPPDSAPHSREADQAGAWGHPNRPLRRAYHDHHAALLSLAGRPRSESYTAESAS